MRRRVIILFLLTMSAVFCQEKFENLTMRNGLASNKINFCLQDSRGFVWFATDNGLSRYNGISFKTFNSDNSKDLGLTETIMVELFEKSNDEIIAISYSGTLFSYSYSSGRFTNINLTEPSLKDRYISSIFKDSKNEYWFSSGATLIKADANFKVKAEYTLTDKNEDPTVSNNILSICEDSKGIFWLGMLSRSVFRFDPSTGIFSQKELYKVLPKLQQVKSIVKSTDPNFIFIATGGEGLFKVNINNFSAITWRFKANDNNSLPSDRVTSLYLQNDTILWIGTLDGLSKLNLASQTFTRYISDPKFPYSIINNFIYHLYFDSQNILWVSTFGGVSKLETLPPRFSKVSQEINSVNTISSNKICHVTEDKFGNLWIASSKGIDIRTASNKFYHYNLPKSFVYHKNEEIVKFFIDGNTWWIGTWGGGLSRFHLPSKFTPGDELDFVNFHNVPSNHNSLSSNFIRSFAKDRQGNIWVTTWNGGLNRIDAADKEKNNIRFYRYMERVDSLKTVASNFIDPIICDSENVIWFGTSIGLQYYDIDLGVFNMFYPDPKNLQLPINISVCLLKDDNNIIWSGTFGGLVKMSIKKNLVISHQIIYSNSDRGIYTINKGNDGKIWFATLNSEIGSYNPESGKLKFYSMFEEVGGFDFYHGDSYKDSKGNIYFVGNSGYVYFNPVHFNENNVIPKMYLTSVKFGDKEYQFSSDISNLKVLETAYDQRNITIQFAAMNYIHPERNEYKYIIEGFDKSWNNLGNKNEISFINLPAGTYTLKIVGSNNDGVWNYQGIKLILTIKPPFWQNNYFRLFFVTLLALIIFLYYNSKIRQFKKEREQQNIFSKMLIESQEEERKRLSQELHDSLGQNLLVIKNRLDMYESAKVKDDSELSEISNLVKESISEVKDISSNLHPHQLERLGLTKAIKSLISKIGLSSHIEIESHIEDISGLLAKEKEINIYRIIQESFNNIVKHSSASRARFEISRKENKILLSIEDFGKGFDISVIDLKEGLGIKSITERVRHLNGELIINSAPEKGTKIYISINIA